MKAILHALSYGNIELESSRRMADLKQLDAMRIFVKKLDVRVYNGEHEVPAGGDRRGKYISDSPVFPWWRMGN